MLIFLIFFWSFAQVHTAVLKNLDVKCNEDKIEVFMSFYSKFNGIIFSHGYYDNPNCHYVRENSGRNTYRFYISVRKCGTTSRKDYLSKDVEKYIENTLVIQEDPFIQGMHDLARNVRCTWRHTFNKVVTARPMSFNSIPLVFTKESVNKVTPLNLNSGPFEYPVSGYIYIGKETSMVVYIQDPSHVFDANVKGCYMNDEKGRKKMLTRPDGCYSRKDMMTPFYKTNSTADSGASTMFYAYFQGYKLSYRDNFAINCELEVCPGNCLTPCQNPVVKRRKRDIDILIPETQDRFFRPTNASPVRKNSTIDGIECRGSINCVPIGWIVSIALMVLLIAILLVLSTYLCYRISKYNKFFRKMWPSNGENFDYSKLKSSEIYHT